MLAWLALGTVPVSANANSLNVRAEYDVNANINWANGSMTVSSTAHVTNTTSRSLSRLAFNLLPLRLGHLQGLTASAGGQKVSPTRSDQTVIVNLPTALKPGRETNVTIGYKAFFNSSTGGKKSLFMKKSSIATAYRWIPWLSRQQKFNTPNFGESWVTATSRRVAVHFTSDVALKFATSGEKIRGSGTNQTFVARMVRDFNFAASPNYEITKTTFRGVKVRFLHRTMSAAALKKWTLQAMNRFSDRIGAYPWDHLDVAEIPTGTGMESPAMTWVDASLAKSRFPYIVVHETSHQWFYGGIGNNQATEPFLDESVGDFLTRDALDDFRKSQCAKARLDKSVYSYQGRCYNEVIYIQGGLYLRDYRDEVGANKFWEGMHQFWMDRKFEIASTRSFLDHLDAASGFDSRLHEDRFPSLY
jgi:hypothetical protein